MKLRGILALALMLGCAPALSQVNPGTSPLTGPKGGTNNAFMQFSGPATSLKTYTLPNANSTLAALGAIQTWTGAQSFTDGTLILLGSGSGSSTIKAPATGGGTATLFPGTDTIAGLTTAQVLTNKTIDCASNTCTNFPASAAIPISPQGRITLTSGVAITTTDVAGATVHYYTPAPGRYLPITTDGVNFTPTQFFEASQATTDTVKSPAAVANSSVYDILGWQDSSTITVTAASPAVVTWTANGFRAGAAFSCTTAGGSPPAAMPDNTPFFVISAGLAANSFEFALTAGGAAVNTASTGTGTRTCTTIRATRGPAWTSDTNRGSGAGTSEVDFTTRFPTNKNAVTNGPAANKGTVLGSVRSNGSAQLMDSAAFRWVSNAYLCDNRKMAVVEATATWTYTTATYRQANASAANQLDFLQTFAGNQLNANVASTYSNTSVSTYGSVGIDIDSVNTTSIVNNINHLQYVQLTGSLASSDAFYNDYPGLGRHVAIWKELSTAAGAGTFYGTAGGTQLQSGIYGSICN